jgi:hypothetical protein
VATVTGFTAERMLEIENSTVIDGSVVGDDLILETRDGTLINAGSVIGPAGPTGPAASFAGYDEPMDDKGNVSGAVTLDFATHNVWRIVPTGNVTITFANLPAVGYITPGTLIVANSTYTITWPGGTKYPSGAAPVLSGETWLTMVARSTLVTVGAAWTGVA